MARKAATRGRKEAAGRTRKTTSRSTAAARKAAGARAGKTAQVLSKQQGSPGGSDASPPPEVEIRMDHHPRHQDLRALRFEDDDSEADWLTEEAEEDDPRSRIEEDEDEWMLREDDEEEEW